MAPQPQDADCCMYTQIEIQCRYFGSTAQKKYMDAQMSKEIRSVNVGSRGGRVGLVPTKRGQTIPSNGVPKYRGGRETNVRQHTVIAFSMTPPRFIEPNKPSLSQINVSWGGVGFGGRSRSGARHGRCTHGYKRDNYVVFTDIRLTKAQMEFRHVKCSTVV